ncbi:MAG: GyrI-like domain-containing protein [Spirochaetes bacterium]|nr:GyrI-like domain-containing protein [Spirochaetota bacterium]
MTIPKGKYAVARFELKGNEFTEAWNWLYAKWLPQSGYEPDDRPCFELYPEEKKENQKFIVDIYCPVRPS